MEKKKWHFALLEPFDCYTEVMSIVPIFMKFQFEIPVLKILCEIPVLKKMPGLSFYTTEFQVKKEALPSELDI